MTFKNSLSLRILAKLGKIRNINDDDEFANKEYRDEFGKYRETIIILLYVEINKMIALYRNKINKLF